MLVFANCQWKAIENNNSQPFVAVLCSLVVLTEATVGRQQRPCDQAVPTNNLTCVGEMLSDVILVVCSKTGGEVDPQVCVGQLNVALLASFAVLAYPSALVLRILLKEEV